MNGVRTVVEMKRPRRLYKYRSFNGRTLTMLARDDVYFADPTTFNDPLDTQPELSTDVDNDALGSILTRLIEQRISAERYAAAKAIDPGSPETSTIITQYSRRAAEQSVADLRNHPMHQKLPNGAHEQLSLKRGIRQELLRRYDRGVFSLAERANCPLMWSHYGDEHRGLCMGYSIPDGRTVAVHKIQYGASRLVRASAVARMLDGDDVSRREVDDAVLLSKAKPWRYEREWRLIGQRGERCSPLELQEVVFGMRCSDVVKYAVTKTLEVWHTGLQFHEIYSSSDNFILRKRALDLNKMLITIPAETDRSQTSLTSKPRTGPTRKRRLPAERPNTP